MSTSQQRITQFSRLIKTNNFVSTLTQLLKKTVMYKPGDIAFRKRNHAKSSPGCQEGSEYEKTGHVCARVLSLEHFLICIAVIASVRLKQGLTNINPQVLQKNYTCKENQSLTIHVLHYQKIKTVQKALEEFSYSSYYPSGIFLLR